MPDSSAPTLTTTPAPLTGRISVRLAVLFCLALAPLIIFDIHWGLSLRQKRTAATLADLARTADLVAHEHTTLIESGRDLLLALGQVGAVRGVNTPACTDIMVKVGRQYARYTVFSVVDTDGWIVCSSRPAPAPVNVATASNIVEALNEKRFALSRFVIGPISGKPVLVLSDPMLGSNGEVLGIVNTGINLDWLTDYLAGLSLSPDLKVRLFDGKRRLLAEYPGQGTPIGEALPQSPMLEKVMTQNKGRGELVGPDGDVHLAGYSHVMGVPGDLHVLVTRPRDQVMADLNREAARQALIAFWGLAFSLLLAWGGARVLILRWTRAINRLAGRLAAGDYSARSELVGDSEMGRLARSMNTMAARLQDRDAHLRQREEELSFRNLLLATQQDMTREGILVVDDEQNVMSFNQRFLDIWNLTAKALAPRDADVVLSSMLAQVENPEAFVSYTQELSADLSLQIHDEEITLVDGRVLERYSRGLVGSDGRYWGRIWFYHDATRRKLYELQLHQAAETANALLNAPSDSALLLDADHHVLAINQVGARRFGRTPEDMVGLVLDDLLAPPLLETRLEHIARAMATGRPQRFEDERDGMIMDSVVYPVLAETGVVERLAVFSRDITEQRLAEAQVRKLSLAVEHSPAQVLITDPEGVIEYVNPRFREVKGYHDEDVMGRTPALFTSGEHPASFYQEMWTTITAGGRWRGEIKNRTADGGLIWEQVSISPVLDASGGIVNFVALMEDITEKRQAEETIRRLALHDTLTGLPNRYRFQEELAGALARNKRRGTRLGLVFLDLDGFKAINDSLGHEAGDEVLVEVAARLGRCVREGDIVARLGGDEFTVILDDMEHPEKAGEVADRILESLARPFDLDGRSRHVGASMGIAVAPDHAETSRELIRLADAAMYRVKESGKNGWALHEQPA